MSTPTHTESRMGHRPVSPGMVILSIEGKDGFREGKLLGRIPKPLNHGPPMIPHLATRPHVRHLQTPPIPEILNDVIDNSGLPSKHVCIGRRELDGAWT